MTTPPVTFVLAGSEATGGAGVQADLRTLQELGVYGAAALTCIVSFDPNDDWNHRFVPIDPQVLRDQAEAILADWQPASVKIGMLGTVPTIETTRDILGAAKLPNIVCDPVLICKGQEPGAALDIDNALRAEILPIVDADSPLRSAIFDRDQCVALAGVDSSVATTTSSTCSAVTVAGRPGRGSSTSPSRRCSRNRALHLPTVGRLTPSRSATTVFAAPVALSRTIRERNARA